MISSGTWLWPALLQLRRTPLWTRGNATRHEDVPPSFPKDLQLQLARKSSTCTIPKTDRTPPAVNAEALWVQLAFGWSTQPTARPRLPVSPMWSLVVFCSLPKFGIQLPQLVRCFQQWKPLATGRQLQTFSHPFLTSTWRLVQQQPRQHQNNFPSSTLTQHIPSQSGDAHLLHDSFQHSLERTLHELGLIS